ncbi:MAG TPA: PadR family transcriptional regulator [Steroidobacteraceae bacterium]|jgi:DNA-binding PadR family transcriptional regulator
MERTRKPSAHTLLVLEALSKRPRDWHYGYELSQLTGLKSGTLYPILMRLCDRALLDSDWQPAAQSGRPPRHVYRFTAAGATFARGALSPSSASMRRRLTAGGLA